MKKAVLTSFACARCNSPLQIDRDTLNLRAESLGDILGPENGSDSNNKSPSLPPVVDTSASSSAVGKQRKAARSAVSGTVAGVSRVTAHSTKQRTQDLPAHASTPLASSVVSISDVEVQEVDVAVDQSIVNRLRQTARVFDLWSARSRLDFPVCQECADSALNLAEQELSQLQADRNAYEGLLRMEESIQDIEEVDQDDLEALVETETKLRAKLEDIKRQRVNVQAEIAALEIESAELDSLEQQVWAEVDTVDETMSTLQLGNESLNNQYEAASQMLELCKKTNVYNDTFHIWHDGPFGTINGFRLGRLPDQHVDWTEINAAWGHACLLLYVLAQKINFDFKEYRLVPEGSFSRIEKVNGDRASYELYGHGELQISRLFWNRRFDQGMVAFLACTKQLADFAAGVDATFKLPYAIQQDTVGEISIRMQFQQGDVWTRACKYLLTDLKWLLAFCCKYQPSSHS